MRRSRSRARSARPRRAVRDDDVGDAARAQRRREPGTHLAGADHEHAGTVEVAEILGRDRDRGGRDRHRVARDPGLGAHALARLDRVLEHARQQLRRGLLAGRRSATRRGPGRGSRSRRRSSSRARPRPRTGARPRLRRSTCRGGRRTRRDRRPSARPGSRGRRRPRRGSACSARRSRCGCTSRASTTSSRCSRAARSCSAFASRSSGTVMRSRSSTGTVRWFRPTTRRDTSSTTPLPRRRDPYAPVSTMPPSNADCQLASSDERPEPRNSSRASESMSSRVSYSGPISSSSRRRRCAASAGLRPPVPTVTTRSPRRITDISVKEQLAGSSALLTQTRAASPAAWTAALTPGSSVAVSASHAPSRSAPRNGRSCSTSRPASAQFRTSAPTAGATTSTAAPASSSGSILRAAMRPAPTTTTRRPRTSRFTG